MKKKSIEEVKELFRKGGVEPLFKKYISANIPLKFKCICGSEDIISITSLKRSLKTLGNIRCNKCRFDKISWDKNDKAKNEILDKFKEINIINIIPGAHGKFPPKIIFECAMCGNKDSLFYNKRLELLLCKECSNNLRSEKQRLSQEEVKELFSVGGATLISEYKHINQKLLFQCSCGDIGNIMLTNLKYKGIKPLCKKCQLKYSYPKGENSSNWDSDLTEENRLSWGRNNEDKQWYRKIFEKFGYTCFILEKKNIPLSAHHLFQYSKYPDLRLDLENGICISRELHLEFHKRYSYINSSIEDFCNFFYEKVGIKFEEYYDISNKKWRESEMKAFTIEEAKKFVIKCGAKPLFEEYINNYSDYLVRCSCGNEEKIKFSTLGRNLKKDPEYKYQCSRCRNNGRPIHSIESLKKDFLKCGVEPLFEEYKSLRSKLKYKCFCGKISDITCEQFYTRIKAQGEYKLLCQSCACKVSKNKDRNTFFKKIIIPFFEENKIELLSKEYENNHIHLKFRCFCGNETQASWGSLKKNKCFKCRSCQIKDIPRGENHPDWNFNLTQEDRNRTRYGRGNLENIWESFILNLADYTCIISGQKGGKLSAHHLNSWARNPLERYYLSNGVCISRELHKEFHDIYGMKRGDNTLEQFQEFYKNKMGQEFNSGDIIIDFIEETLSPISLLEKKKSFFKKDKKYIPFFIPELNSKRDIVSSMIRYKYGKIRHTIYARNLEIKEIKDFNKVRSFLDENHIQGWVISSINLALIDNKENIFSLMTFSEKKINKDDEYMLQRFCSKININVPGGASKLFKYFIKKYDPNKVITYGDIRFSDLIPNENSIYIKLGFKYTHSSKPNYWYTRDNINLIFRRRFQKSNLSKILKKEVDLSLTEREIMVSEGYQRLYDCGNHVFVYEKENSF